MISSFGGKDSIFRDLCRPQGKFFVTCKSGFNNLYNGLFLDFKLNIEIDMKINIIMDLKTKYKENYLFLQHNLF